MTQAVVTAQNGGADYSGTFRNKIINGDMRIDQRNAGASISAGLSTFTVDRWPVYASVASKGTAGQNLNAVTPPTGFSNYLGFQTGGSAYSVTSSDLFFFYQNIEGYNTSELNYGTANAKTVTVSFWVNSSLTGTFGALLTNSAYNRAYGFTYTISAANTWTYISVPVPGDTSGTWVGGTNGIGMTLRINLGCGSSSNVTAGSWQSASASGVTGTVSVLGTANATFYFTGVQLEVGTQATPFERRPYGMELAQCQRYYYRTPAQGDGAQHYNIMGRITGLNQSVFTSNLPVSMRTYPAISLTPAYNTGSGWQTNLAGVSNAAWTSAPTQLSPELNKFCFYVGTATWSGTYVGTSVQPYTPTGVAANYIELNAEL